MSDAHRRGVTRGYVGGLIFAVAVVAVSLLVAAWGVIALLTGVGPVATPGMSMVAPALIVMLNLAVLAWGLWLQSLVLLRGQRTPPWAHTLVLGVGGYLVWCLGGLAAGLGIQETWLSLYSAALGLVWAICSLLCWAVLARRVYTDRPTPQWPWEKRGEPGPDWIDGDNPWTGGDGSEER